jgi:hypothetical protein
MIDSQNPIEAFVYRCRTCKSGGVRLLTDPTVLDKVLNAHEGHNFEICSDEKCQRPHWINSWTHQEIVSFIRD